MPIATSGDRLILSSEKNTEELAKKLQKKLKLGDVFFCMVKWVSVKLHLLDI